MMKKQKSHQEDFVMGKKHRHNTVPAGADELFFVITMDNGTASQACNSRQEVLDWLDENFVNSLKAEQVSHITVKRLKRRSALLREAERKSEIAVLERRLKFLTEQPSVQTEGQEAL